MNIHAEIDDPAEVALKYCEQHGLDYAEHGPHVEVEIHKDMLEVCRKRIEKLRKQRDDLNFKIEQMTDSSLGAKLKQAVELLQVMEKKKVKLEKRLDNVKKENKNYMNLVSWHAEKANDAENKAKKHILNITIESHVAKKTYEKETSNTIKQLKDEHLDFIKKNDAVHQQLLESATAAAMDRANESEREVQVQLAALKVLSLSKDEEIEKIKKQYEEKLRQIKGNVQNLDKIVEANNQTIAKRNNKIKKLKESYEEKIKQHQQKYNKKAHELQEAISKMQEVQETMEIDHKKDIANALKAAKMKYHENVANLESKLKENEATYKSIIAKLENEITNMEKSHDSNSKSHEATISSVINEQRIEMDKKLKKAQTKYEKTIKTLNKKLHENETTYKEKLSEFQDEMAEIKKNHKQVFTAHKKKNRVESKTKLKGIESKYEEKIRNLRNELVQNESAYKTKILQLKTEVTTMEETQQQMTLSHDENIAIALKNNRIEMEEALIEVKKKHDENVEQLKKQLKSNEDEIQEQKVKEKELLEKMEQMKVEQKDVYNMLSNKCREKVLYQMKKKHNLFFAVTAFSQWSYFVMQKKAERALHANKEKHANFVKNLKRDLTKKEEAVQKIMKDCDAVKKKSKNDQLRFRSQVHKLEKESSKKNNKIEILNLKVSEISNKFENCKQDAMLKEQKMIENNKRTTSDLRIQVQNLKRSIKLRQATSEIIQKELEKAVEKTVDLFVEKRNHVAIAKCFFNWCNNLLAKKLQAVERKKHDVKIKKLLDRHKTENVTLVEEATKQKKKCLNIQEELRIVKEDMINIKSVNTTTVQSMRATNEKLHKRLRDEEVQHRVAEAAIIEMRNQLSTINNEKSTLLALCENLEGRLSSQQDSAANVMAKNKCNNLLSHIFQQWKMKVETLKFQKWHETSCVKMKSKFENEMLQEKQKFHTTLNEKKHDYELKLNVENKKMYSMMETYENSLKEKELENKDLKVQFEQKLNSKIEGLKDNTLMKRATLWEKALKKKVLTSIFIAWKYEMKVEKQAKYHVEQKASFEVLSTALKSEIKSLNNKSIEMMNTFKMEKATLIKTQQKHEATLKDSIASNIKNEYDETIMKPLLSKFELEKHDLIEEYQNKIATVNDANQVIRLDLENKYKLEKIDIKRRYEKEIEKDKEVIRNFKNELKDTRLMYEQQLKDEKLTQEQVLMQERTTHRHVLNTLRKTIETTNAEHRKDVSSQKNKLEAKIKNLKDINAGLEKKAYMEQNTTIINLNKEIERMKISIDKLATENMLKEQDSENQTQAIRASIEKDFTERLAEKNKELQSLQEQMKVTMHDANEKAESKHKSLLEAARQEYESRLSTLKNVKANELNVTKNLIEEQCKNDIFKMKEKVNMDMKSLTDKYLKTLKNTQSSYEEKLDLLESKLNKQKSISKSYANILKKSSLKHLLRNKLIIMYRLSFSKWRSLPGIKNQVKRQANNDDLQILKLTKKTPVKEMDYKDNSNVKSDLYTPKEIFHKDNSNAFTTPGGDGRVTTRNNKAKIHNDKNSLKTSDEKNSSHRRKSLLKSNASNKSNISSTSSKTDEFKMSKGSKFSRGRVLADYNVAMKYYIKYRKMMHQINVNGENKVNNETSSKMLLQSAKIQFFKVKDICEEGLSSNGATLDPCLLLYKARALSCASVVEDAMDEIHAAVTHGHEAAMLFRSMDEDEKEYQTLANTYIAKIRVYTEEKTRNSDHLRIAYKYVLRMLEIAKKSNSQAKEIDRLKRRISNLTATLRGQKTIEWISGKGNVRKVVFRDIKQKKLVKNENSRPKKFTTLDAKVNKGPKARARPFYNAINNENDRMLRNKKELLQKDKSKRSEGSLSSGSVEFY